MSRQQPSTELLASEPYRFQTSIDYIQETKPSFVSKSFTYTGHQEIFNREVNNFHNYDQEYAVQNGASFRQYNITLIGEKVSPYDPCCRNATIIAGIFFIFPLCFMCCEWWKRKVYPLYQLQTRTYENVGRMIQKMNGVLLNLRAIDNNFNREKAQVLAQAISHSKLTHFNFQNMAFRCNFRENELRDFQDIVKPLKELHIKTKILWQALI